MSPWWPLELARSFESLTQYVAAARQAGEVFPPEDSVFRAFEMSTFASVRVVILGQDPYHGPGQANGLAFSVSPGVKLPPSLRNIFRELESDLGLGENWHRNAVGDLSPWARQGVLLLNTVLTVNRGQANSHRGQGWESFTDGVVRLLGRREAPIVFVLWGKPAEKKALLVEGTQHRVLVAPHPSPLSAHRGFFGSQPFSQINDQLAEWGQTPIDWTRELLMGH